MNFCFYLSGLNNSGVSVVTCRIASYLAKYHDVDILVDGPVENRDMCLELYNNVNFIFLSTDENNIEVNSPNIKNKKLLLILKKTLKPLLGRFCWELIRASGQQYRNKDFSKYDRVFVCCLSGKFRFAFNHAKNIVYIIHNQKSIQLKSGNRLGDLMDKYFFKASCYNRRLITVSQSVKKDIVSNFGVEESNIRVIYNPLNICRDYPIIPKRINNILVIGRLNYQKRIDRAITAFNIFKNNNLNDSKLIIIGKGELESELKKQSQLTKYSSDIKFLGHQSNILDHISQSKMVLISSDYEGFSTVAVESILTGTKVVASPSESLKEINELIPGGVELASNMSSSSLAKSIEIAFNKNDNLDKSISELLKIIVSPDECIKKYEQ